MAIFTVINTNDSGPGSLRQAVIDANANPGSTIIFSVIGVITITGTSMTISATMTIVGPGAPILNVQRTAGTDRIFIISASSVVNISGLTISRGNVTGNGGAISTNTNGITLNISDCIFENNTATNLGGAVFISQTTISTITNTIFRNNTAANGGAIFVNSSTTCTISNCSFNNNIASAIGGAIAITILSTFNISDSTIQNNSAGSFGGGGISISTVTTVNITNTIISNNITTGSGGGIICQVTTTTIILNNCTIDSNTATLIGGGFYTSCLTRIFNTTFSNNSSGTIGGGLDLSATPQKILINCTFSGNIAGTNGGGITLEGTNATTINLTISNNTATTSGGGIFMTGTSTLTIGNTVVAANPIGTIPDFAFGTGTNTITSLGFNFIGNATGTGATFTQPGDQAGTTVAPINPLLLPLGNYGGPTETMLPISVISPLIDAGSNSIVTTYYIYPQVLNSGSPIDQRGFSRIVNGTVDIGSDETGNFICFCGESEVLTKNILTDKIQIIQAKNIRAGIHEVFNSKENIFVPVKYNVVNGPVTRLWKISKNSLGPNQPNEDFFVTGGHKLVINGTIMKARDIPQAERVKVKSQKVYSICTENQVPILINGLDVLTWSDEKFIEYAKKQNIMWIDCQPLESVSEPDNL